MNLNQFEYFISIADTLSFTKSAEILHITQPALTHAINKLETEIGAPLFIKKGKKLQLSPQGEIFYQYSKEALQVITRGINEIRKQNEDKIDHLSFAIVNNMDMRCFEPIFDAFHEKYPKINLHFHEINYSNILTELKIQTYNFAVCGYHDKLILEDNFSFFHVMRYKCYAYVRKDSSLARQDEIECLDFRNQHMVFISENARISISQCQPDILLDIDNSSLCSNFRMALNIIKKQNGILLKLSAEPDDRISEDIAAVPLKNKFLDFGIMWNTNTKYSFAEKMFIDFLRNY